MIDKNPPYPPCISNGWALDLDISRLHRSDTWAILDKASRPYLLMLLTVAWCESPCGSLPNNDRILCSKLGIDTTLFIAIKHDLLRGWEECSDGRLYHPVMAESVLKMTEWREKQAKKVAAWREKKSKESVSVTGNKLVTNGLVTAVSVSVSDADINTNKEKVKKEKAEKPTKQTAPQCPADVSPEIWSEWNLHRKKKRAQITDRVVSDFRKEAESVGMSLEDAIKHSMAKDWRGFEAAWVLNSRGMPQKAAKQPHSSIEYVTAMG